MIAWARFRTRSIRLGVNAGISTEAREGMEARVLATSERTGIDASELLAGLETSFERFKNLDSVVANLDRLADVSLAIGASFNDIVGATGAAERQFSLTAEETNVFLDEMLKPARA